MTDGKFSLKKYNDYPVIVDNEKNVELTLDTAVGILNEYEYSRKFEIQEYNNLHKQAKYAIAIKREVESQKNELIFVIFFMAIIILIETLILIRVG